MKEAKKNWYPRLFGGSRRKIISSSVIVYYYHKAVFTTIYREKTVFSSINTKVVWKKLRGSQEVGIG